MKAIATEVFIDKYTGEEYPIGTVIEIKEADRMADLEKRGLAKAIETVVPAKATKKSRKE